MNTLMALGTSFSVSRDFFCNDIVFLCLSSVLDDTEHQPRSFKVFDCLLFKILVTSAFVLDMHP